MRYYIIAGEASGDLHGSNLMRGLYAEDPEADIRFWGGGLMDAVYKEHQQGTGLVKDYKDGAVIGFTQILLHVRAFAKRFTDCTTDILRWKPDVVILIDYPGFNFRVAEFAHKAGFKVFYYIAPKVWASRESRVKKLKAFVDKLFIVFPFEIPYFTEKGVDFIYKGNPLIDAIDNSEAFKETREEFLAKTGLPDRPMIALLAGSRNGEKTAVEQACEKAKAEGAKRALPLAVSGAFHSPLMEPARVELGKAIEETRIVEPICPIYQNVSAQAVTDPQTIKKNLLAQLTSPVRWTQSVRNMLADGADYFMEIGPGTVLQGLVKRISAGTEGITIEGLTTI